MKYSKFVAFLSSSAIILAMTAQTALAVEAFAKSDVNVRSGPGTEFSRVDTLNGGEAVDILECSGNWCYVQHPGPDGWVSANYLAAVGGGAGGGSGGGSGSGGGAGAGSGSGSSGADAAAAAILGLIIGGIVAGSGGGSPPPPPPDPGASLPYGPDTCVDGFVWRDIYPGDHVCVTVQSRAKAAHENDIAGSRVDPAGAYGPNTCKPGFVWREAYAGDKVCVVPDRRSAVATENAQGPSHRVLP